MPLDVKDMARLWDMLDAARAKHKEHGRHGHLRRQHHRSEEHKEQQVPAGPAQA